MRTQPPVDPRRTHPFTGLRIAPVNHAQDDSADHGVEGQVARLALARGEKRAGRLGLRLESLL